MPKELVHEIDNKIFISIDDGKNWTEKKPYEHIINGKRYTSVDGENWTLYRSPTEQAIKVPVDIRNKIYKLSKVYGVKPQVILEVMWDDWENI